MAKTESTMRSLGSPAPDFELPDTEGRLVKLADFDGYPTLVVAFICNHCPFVKHIFPAFVEFAKDCREWGGAVVAINANDVEAYPDDAPAHMAELMARYGHPFPYLYDETQAVAKAYGAACTPDFFVFDQAQRLAYRGRFDGSTPGNEVTPTGNELREAVSAVLNGQAPAQDQQPSLGCNIKWKSGNAPEYA